MSTMTETTYASVGMATGKSVVVGQPLGFYFPATDPVHVGSPDSAYGLFAPMMHGADREMCLMALLDARHNLIGTKVVSLGCVDATYMTPREVYRDALLGNAAAIIVAHNHPSGDANPSDKDRAVTYRLHTAGGHIGIDLLDHLVVGGDSWTSLAREGAC